MEGYLDAYDPTTSATPAGVFVNRVEVTNLYIWTFKNISYSQVITLSRYFVVMQESEFECVPTCLMDNVISFLNVSK